MSFDFFKPQTIQRVYKLYSITGRILRRLTYLDLVYDTRITNKKYQIREVIDVTYNRQIWELFA